MGSLLFSLPSFPFSPETLDTQAMWLKEREILPSKRACVALWLKERGILHFEACKMT